MQAPSFALESSDVVLDVFEFTLEEENDDLILDSSQRSSAIGMDFQFDAMKESLTSSMNELTFDDVNANGDDDEESEEEREHIRRPRSDARSSQARRSLLSNSKKFELPKTINFDPPANGSRTAPHHDDVSIDSYNTAQTTQPTQHVNTALKTSASLSSLGHSSVITNDEYSEALAHFAQTMKKTEESRKLVMIQRNILAQQQEQQRRAEEQARQQVAQAIALRRASAMNTSQFFTSTGTLTSGLAQSRRQLQMYMAQMNGQTF